MRNVTVVLTPAEARIVNQALAYYETVLEETRDLQGLPSNVPDTHPLQRAWRKILLAINNEVPA
jgi:hypothetical protein